MSNLFIKLFSRNKSNFVTGWYIMNFEGSGGIKSPFIKENPEAHKKLKQYIHKITLSGKTSSLAIANNVWLAPLAGVTDLSFRIVCKESYSYLNLPSECSPGLVFSEMISAKGVHYKGNNSILLANTDEKEAPMSVQIFGSESDIMAECAVVFKERGAKAIDINMGCPMQKITSNAEGSALMKNPQLIEKIVKSVSEACGLPTTVKIRRGYEIGKECCVEAALAAEAGGAAAVTVHGRYRDEYYSGVSNLSAIKKVKKALKIPVIGNGDIISSETALKMFEETGCDGIMIGRGALGRPWIFSYLLSAELPEPILPEQISKIINTHIDYAVKFKGESHGITEMRKHLAWYTKGMRSAAAIRDKIFKATTLKEAQELIEILFKENM